MSEVHCYLNSYNSDHCRIMRAFARGSGGKLLDASQYKPSPVAVIFGMCKSTFAPSHQKGRIIEQHMGKLLVLERGFVRRDEYWSAGWSGINGGADFNTAKALPSDRWDALGVELKPWRQGGEFVLVCGQVPWDVTVQHTDHLAWCQHIVLWLLLEGYQVRFRPHPYAVKRGVQYGVRCPLSDPRASLQDDLQGALACVTYNSNAGVEALIEGVPVLVDGPRSMAAPLASPSIRELKREERQPWASALAYSQWTEAEMQQGLPWRHLNS